ncbi:hypothetical protein F5Y09DRAFT_73939 [Xylaria sp. FL1042]|nr:hypothetical protein F5Y09DRAFT_73939 [Xylaria sp. FL1042]
MRASQINMSSLKVLKTFTIGKGQTMDIIEDKSAAEDSIDRYFSEATFTGEELFKVPPHWHKKHDEYIRVMEGRAKITLDGKEIIVKAGDPPVLIARRVVHSIETFEGERAVIQERPSPGGIYKAMFFNDMFCKGPSPGFWYLMRAFYDGDGYIALPLYFRFFDVLFITVFGGIAHLFTAPRPQSL